ncbi:MAG: hypothetical protein PHR25_00575 [Clostridia bacterium]|nr:hypothetical protein [Clostridia bacterium]MDD4375264.1 hypothetical protein [Clostridia bacterium]
MRYYLYRDVDLVKEIYSQFIDLDIELDEIDHIDARTIFQEDGIFVEPEGKICKENEDQRIKMGARSNGSTSITRISDFSNMQDVKEIYNRRFYHKLIENLRCKKIKCPGIHIEYGKINYMQLSSDFTEQFIEVNGTYIWFEYNRMDNNIQILSRITGEINVIGCLIKEANNDSPKIIKAIAMYTE